jgi:hypothetical protein
VNDARPRDSVRGFLVDLALVAALVVVLGLVVGVLWPQLVEPMLSERTAQGISTSEVQLGKAFSADGWFVALGFLGSLVLGAVLMLRRRGHEVVVLLLLLVGTYLAADQVAQPLGKALGPPDPVKVLSDAEVGDTAPARLRLTSRADQLSWPLGAAVGAVVVLLAATRLERDREDGATPDESKHPAPTPAAD